MSFSLQLNNAGPVYAVRVKCCACGLAAQKGQPWGRYAKTGRLKSLCPNCDERLGRVVIPGRQEKRCGICRDVKPLSAFTKLHCSVDGHRNECTACRNPARALSPWTVKGKALRACLDKTEKRLAKELAASARRANKKTPEQLAESARLSYKTRYDSNPDRERERSTRYKHANPDKVEKWGGKRKRLAAEQSDGSLTPEAVGRLFAAARKCPYCNCKLKGAAKSLDHLDPLNEGGTHGISNVVICCRTCNIKKNARPFAEWLAKIPEVNRPDAQRLYRRVRGFEPSQQSLALSYAASV